MPAKKDNRNFIPLEDAEPTAPHFRLSNWVRDGEGNVPGWLDARFAENDVVVALPRYRELGWNDVLPLTDDEDAMESEFSQGCESAGMLGVNRRGFVRSDVFRKAAKFDNKLTEQMSELGWSEQHIASLNQLSDADDVALRTTGATGWLVCHQAFRTERDEIRAEWARLPPEIRPLLPLTRTVQVSVVPAGAEALPDSPLAQFVRRFDAFCDKWYLNGMTLWELPDIMGPQMSGLHHRHTSQDRPLGDTDPCTSSGLAMTSVTAHFEIPPYFPLLNHDGMGDQVTQNHRLRAEALGIDDLDHWQTYAQILKIGFWTNIVQSRYRGLPQPQGAISKCDGILAKLLGQSIDRVRRLRGVWKQFQTGKRTSLKGFR